MTRLTFDFYRNLVADLDSYETYFSQLLRDYERERSGRELILSVDFSEIYPYIHYDDPKQVRVAANTYVINTLQDTFTLLPGALGEALTDLRKLVPDQKKIQAGTILSEPSVARFLNEFPNVRNEGALIELYSGAEEKLQKALGELLTIISKGHEHSAVKKFQELFQNKLKPLSGLGGIGPFDDESRTLFSLINNHLNATDPNVSRSNEIDSIDAIIAYNFNKKPHLVNNGYISIYTQAGRLISAVRSHDKLIFDGDYIVRDLPYLKYRARLQQLFPSLGDRINKVSGCLRLCKRLISEISNLIDFDEQLKKKAIEIPTKLLDAYRQFDEECRVPINYDFTAESKKPTENKNEEIKRIYQVLVDHHKFEGEMDAAYDVLKEHIRTVHQQLRSFNPMPGDSANLTQYKKNLKSWLGLNS